MSGTLSFNQQIVLTPKFLDANNNVLFGLDTSVEWFCDNNNVINLIVAGDNLSCIAYSNLVPGYANVFANVASFSLEYAIEVIGPVNGHFLSTAPTANAALNARLGQ